MKKILYKALVIMCSMAMCISFSCCGGDSGDDEVDDETLVLSDAQMDSIGYEMLLDVVAPYDTTAAVPQRVVSLARCLFPANADEYYYQADTYEEAQEHFVDVIVPACLQEKVQTSDDKLILSILDATITFQPASVDGKVAEIDFDLPHIAVIRKLYYVQSEAWPANTVSKSPFKRGEICKDAKGNYYFCVKDAKFENGVLVTVNVRTIDPNWLKNVARVITNQLTLYTDNAGKDAFNALKRYFLYYAEMFSAKLQQFQEDYTDDKAQATYTFLKNVRDNQNVKYMIGSPYWKYVKDPVYGPYYYFDYDYYQCSEGTICHFKTPGFDTIYPWGCQGSSQITFDENYDRSSWTTVVE